jgi:hypothetical protein
VDDVGIAERACDVDDGLDFADVCEKLVAATLALVGSANGPCDVDEVDRRRDDSLRVNDRVERREARASGTVTAPDVRTNRAKG